jgi:hypothetical protein
MSLLFSPHSTPPRLRTDRRINAPSSLLAFAHTQGEAGTPTGGVGNAVVGRSSPVLCVCRRGGYYLPSCKITDPILFSPHSTPPLFSSGGNGVILQGKKHPSCTHCAETGRCQMRSFYTEKSTPPAHRTGLFRPTNAFQMPSVGVPASPWLWARARS